MAFIRFPDPSHSHPGSAGRTWGPPDAATLRSAPRREPEDEDEEGEGNINELSV